MTIEEFERLPDTERHEINAGRLITTPPWKMRDSLLAVAVFNALENYLQETRGCAFIGAGYLLSRDPLTIRQPDVSVLSKERIDATDPEDYLQGAPELAIEIVSPSDAADELEIKVEQYLKFGAKQVWVVYPKTKCAHVFRCAGHSIILKESQTLEGGDLLPGFSVKVADLFV